MITLQRRKISTKFKKLHKLDIILGFGTNGLTFGEFSKRSEHSFMLKIQV